MKCFVIRRCRQIRCVLVMVLFLSFEGFSEELSQKSEEPSMLEEIQRREAPVKIGHVWNMGLGYMQGRSRLSYKIDSSKNETISRDIDRFVRLYSLDFDYSYHLHLYEHLNYYVGTGMSFTQSFLPKGSSIYIPFSYNLPSFLFGLALHVGVSHGFWLFGEYALRILDDFAYTKLIDTEELERVELKYLVVEDWKLALRWAYYFDASIALAISGIWGNISYKPYVFLKSKEAVGLDFDFEWPVKSVRLGVMYFF